MDVRLSAEQVALRDSVRQVVDRMGPRAVKDLEDEGRAAKLDAAVSAAGWRELRQPSGDGWSPLASAVEAAIVAEELAYGLADTSFLGPTLAADLRRLVGGPPAEHPETVLLTADLSGLATAGAAPGVAVDAPGIGHALALDPAGQGHSVVTIGLGGAAPHVDLTRPSARAGDPVGPAPVGRPVATADLEAWTALGLALSCADLVGAMRGAVRLATGYVSDRRQYGVPVGSFQAVQHLLADAHVATEGSRSAALHAAWAVDALEPHEALAAAAVAKAYCARSALAVCETAIQAHGGIGNTWECLAHLYLRRALLSMDLLGGVGPSLQRVLEHQGVAG